MAFDAAAACHKVNIADLSPIDAYYAAAESITVLGGPKELDSSAELGRLLLLGHVSAVETYVRAALTRLIQVCEATRKHAGSQQLSLSSIYYYRPNDVALGLFDRGSLAGYDEIKKAIKRIADYEIRENSVLATTLRKFDLLCHLRHAAVHAHGTVSSAGAAAIGIAGVNQSFSVVVDFARAQEVAAVCRATVQEMNSFLFSETITRWHRLQLLTGDYSKEGERFRRLVRAFWSVRDATTAKTPHKDLYRQSCAALSTPRRGR